MANVHEPAANDRRGGRVRRSKKNSTKVDLTPMVDLGFLLITFFVFTTSMTRPTAMKLYLPAGDIPSTLTGNSTTLTVIPLGDHKIFFYHGELDIAMKQHLFGTTGFAGPHSIGDVIREKQTALDRSGKYSRKDLMLIIKPAAGAEYSNLVDALDEVLINRLDHYSFTDIVPEEKAALANGAGLHL